MELRRGMPGWRKTEPYSQNRKTLSAKKAKEAKAKGLQPCTYMRFDLDLARKAMLLEQKAQGGARTNEQVLEWMERKLREKCYAIIEAYGGAGDPD